MLVKKLERVSLENVWYKYPDAKSYALKNVNIDIEKGQFVVIMGASGAGKTTFCQLLNGIIPHSTGGKLKGVVKILGLNTKKHKTAELAQKVGMVLQDPEAQLFTGMVKSEVAFGPENLGVSSEEIWEKTKWALKVVRLENFLKRTPSSLSGGQKQRLAIASVLSMQPEILVLDEPTSQLDPVGSYEVFSIIKDLNKKYKMTIILATHNSEAIAEFADRVIIFANGEIIGDNIPRNIFMQQDLLDKTWCRAPQVSELANYLNRNGIKLSRFPIITEEAEDCLQELNLGDH